MSYDNDGRYHLVPQAVLPPGVDLLTGSATGPLVDTGLEIDLDPFVSYDTTDPRGRDQVQRFKRVYLHPDTIRELAQVAGIPVYNRETIDGIRAEAYMQGWEARGAREKENRVSDDAGLADRVERLLRALEPDPAPVVEAPAESAADAGEGDGSSDADGGPRRRARSSV